MAKMTERQMLDEVLSMIDSTHWTTNNLACPIYEVHVTPTGRPKRERNPEYDPDFDNTFYKVPKTRVALVRDENGDPVVKKWTYCLVGLILKVAGRPEGEMEEDDLDVGFGERKPMMRVANRVVDLINARLEEESRIKSDALQAGAVCVLENWNDKSSREEVRGVVERTRDSLPA